MGTLAIRTLLATAATAWCLIAAEPADEAAILDGRGTLWRCFVGWKSPALLTRDGQLRPLKAQQHTWMPAEDPEGPALPDWRSRHPAGEWRRPDFEDRDWPQERCPLGPAHREKDWRGPGLTMWSEGSPAQANVVCARARFEVLDPAKGGGLRLRVRFQGGAVVWLNGTEVARSHLPDGRLDFDTLAQPYPDDAYVAADGKPIEGVANEKSTPEQLAQYAKRVRHMEAEIPASLLRKGVNVLAIQVHRAPYKDIYSHPPKEYRGRMFRHWPFPWEHCRLVEASLRAVVGSAVVPNVGRPAGIQVWQPHPWATVTGFDYGDACEPLKPIRLIGARNGAFTAQLVVSSTEAIAGLRASASELSCEKGGRIAAPAVLLRYPQPHENRFDALLDRPPAEVPLRDYRRHRDAPAEKVAMQPLWVTVRVPADARPGEYRGRVTLGARGLSPVEVPLCTRVHDWRLPEPRDCVTHNNLWQSHESVAYRYGVPLWSDRHFGLMGKGLELTRPLANRFCNVHLVCQAFQCGNTESMVRWVAKGGEAYEYDFTVFDRYLNLYEKTLGKPHVLLVDVCVSIHSSLRPKDGSSPVKVSRLDPATGRVEPMGQPPLAPATGVKFWRPVLDQVRARLEKRGWWDVALIGTASDSGPTADEAKTFKEIWPEKEWMFSGHPATKSVAGGIADVRCSEVVWGVPAVWNPAAAKPGALYPRPWKSKPSRIHLAFPRLGAGAVELYQRSDLREYRLKPEKAMQSNLNGIGRVGIDFWEFTDAEGRKRQLTSGGGQFTFNAGVAWFLAAGPDGPVPTTRSEMFREGVQVCEAMSFLQQASESGKLPGELAARIEALVRERARNMLAADGHRDWWEHEDKLFALCAEVAKAHGNGGH